jgi:hypothetical protein
MPPSGRNPVRVGPQEVDEAGDLVGKLGTHNKASRLIKSLADQYPLELVNAQSLETDTDRTSYVDDDEALKLARENFGGQRAVKRVASARVKGAKLPEDEKVVVFLLETKSGRTFRQLLPYSDFKTSRKAYDEAVDNGEVGAGDKADVEALIKRIDKLQAELAAAKDSSREEEEENSGDADLVKGRVPEVEKRIGDWDDEELSRALAAENAKGDKARAGVTEAIEAEQKARKDAADQD